MSQVIFRHDLTLRPEVPKGAGEGEKDAIAAASFRRLQNLGAKLLLKRPLLKVSRTSENPLTKIRAVEAKQPREHRPLRVPVGIWSPKPQQRVLVFPRGRLQPP